MLRGLVLGIVIASACGSEMERPPPPPPDNTGCDGMTEMLADRGAQHVPTDPITYEDAPPASGSHRPIWARWGEHSKLGPEHWVHNLEHGGAVFLHRPDAAVAKLDALRAYAKNRPEDDGGAFRYILAPYDGLPTELAVVAWRWRYLADDVCADEIDTFLGAHYRQAPEDVAADGSFADDFVGR